MNYVLLKRPSTPNQNAARVHLFFLNKRMLWVVTLDHPGTFSDPCFLYFFSCSLTLSPSISISSRLDLVLSDPFIPVFHSLSLALCQIFHTSLKFSFLFFSISLTSFFFILLLLFPLLKEFSLSLLSPPLTPSNSSKMIDAVTKKGRYDFVMVLLYDAY